MFTLSYNFEGVKDVIKRLLERTWSDWMLIEKLIKQHQNHEEQLTDFSLKTEETSKFQKSVIKLLRSSGLTEEMR